MPPDILACDFVPLHCETLDDGTAEREREVRGRGASDTSHAPGKKKEERERESESNPLHHSPGERKRARAIQIVASTTVSQQA